MYSKYEIGEWTHDNPKVLSWNKGITLKIGRFCVIASEVAIFLGGTKLIGLLLIR